MTRNELLEKAKPILFNTEMVQAILEGRKTVTRRCVKFPANRFVKDVPNPNQLSVMEIKSDKVNFHQEPFFSISVKPPFKAGDYLYVRETWHKYIKRVGKGETCHLAEFYGYKASIANSEDAHEPWKPSIHMPKEAARIFLKVTDVRVERLQNMEEEDAINEGIHPKMCPNCSGLDCDLCSESEYTVMDEFMYLWNSTIKKADLDKYGWEANPWVWVIEFERIQEKMFV